MDRQINILILEDKITDAELMQRELRKAGFDCKVQWARDKESFVQALDESIPDLVLADYFLPGFDGLAALPLVHERSADIPVIIVSGAIGEETAIETLKAGATDYVLKHRLDRLGPVVHRALQEAKQLKEYKQSEQERELTVELLRMVNESTTTHDLLQAAATFFQQRSGCEAVGIRLKEGDDYPYFEARGFSQDFLLAENSLCVRSLNGQLQRDDIGNPVIECMCGNIICGRFDPSKPFFTTGGSFWTNSTTQLLASTSEVDRQARTRNRCNGEGYESVALLPLKVGVVRLGLLQLNDRKRGAFSLGLIGMWERMSRHLAVALAKLLAEEALKNQVHLLQRALLPAKYAPIQGYSVASAYIPAYAGEEIGGDFYDVFRIEDGKVGILIGDVSGKGIEAAAMAASTRSAIRAFAHDSSSSSEVMFQANSLLCAQEVDLEHFVTAFLVILDPETGYVNYTSAGHPSPMVYSARGEIDLLSHGGMPLGVMGGLEFEQSEFQLSPSDKIVLYTDGIMEARCGKDQFGLEGIERVLKLSGNLSPKDIVDQTVTEASEWAGGRIADDIAILVISREQ